jgi:hypothetical protein
MSESQARAEIDVGFRAVRADLERAAAEGNESAKQLLSKLPKELSKPGLEGK